MGVVLLLLLLRACWLGRRARFLLLLLHVLPPEGAGGPVQSKVEGGDEGARVETGTEDNEVTVDGDDEHEDMVVVTGGGLETETLGWRRSLAENFVPSLDFTVGFAPILVLTDGLVQGLLLSWVGYGSSTGTAMRGMFLL